MLALPTQENTLYLILAFIVASVAALFIIVLRKDKKLTVLQAEFREKELQLSQQLYETSVLKTKLELLLDKMTEGVFMLDKDFSLLIINPACKKLLGLEDKKKITIFDIVRSFNRHFPIEETIGQVFETGEIRKVSEIKVDEKFFAITVIPVEVAEGVPGVGVLIHDQTEEQVLSHKHEDFMAMIVHELRSPLTVIKGMANLLIRESKKIAPEKEKEILSQMEDSSNKLLEIVNTLLSDTKMDLAKFEIRKRRDNLNKLLEQEIKNYSSLAKEKGLELKLIIDRTLPEFEFDNHKVTQVLNNLISNALKFTDRGEINVRSELEEGTAVVTVEDTGSGIPKEKRPLLFQKFVQLNNSKNHEPGTGLGLVISKGIVEAHGGKIWVEDNKPNGAKFIFSLPLS